MQGDLTQPHDYRGLIESFPDFTIVGGQAVSAWAIAYLDPSKDYPSGFGTSDLDVLAKRKVTEIIKASPEWKSEVPRMWSFDTRLLRMTSRAPDGRLLIVEVLEKVLGLGKEDLEAVVKIERDGLIYQVLDPIAVLKAKATNIRKLNQEGPPPRHDRAHLKLIAQCVPLFLKDSHELAINKPEERETFAKTVSRIFRTLSDRHIVRVVINEGIQPISLIPSELNNSPIEKARTTYEHQMPRLVEFIARHSPVSGG